jgi:hypothetical protein
VETVSRRLFRKFCQFIVFDFIQNEMLLRINTREGIKMYVGIKCGVRY